MQQPAHSLTEDRVHSETPHGSGFSGVQHNSQAVHRIVYPSYFELVRELLVTYEASFHRVRVGTAFEIDGSMEQRADLRPAAESTVPQYRGLLLPLQLLQHFPFQQVVIACEI